MSTSTLFGWYYLEELNRYFAMLGPGIYYQRFCDDIIILAKTKQQLRRAIKKVRITMSRKCLKLRAEKTYIGKTTDPLFYLGYAIHGGNVSITKESQLRMRSKVGHMVLDGRSQKEIEAYLKRWRSSFPLVTVAASTP